MEKILLFQAEQESQIRKTASNMRIKVISVEPEDYGKTLESLANPSVESAVEPFAGKLPEGSLMVFCDVTEKHLDKMLFELRSRKIPVTYKAVLTPANKNWSAPQMFLEMERERLAYLMKNQ